MPAAKRIRRFRKSRRARLSRGNSATLWAARIPQPARLRKLSPFSCQESGDLSESRYFSIVCGFGGTFGATFCTGRRIAPATALRQCLTDVVVLRVRVARCRLRIGVAQQLPDNPQIEHLQGRAIGDGYIATAGSAR